MNNTKYWLIGLAVLALIAVIGASVYTFFYFRAQRSAIELESTVVARQAALTEPTIRTDRFSCDTIAPDSVTESYSVDIRTDSANIPLKQDQVLKLLQESGATITSSNRNHFNEPEGGYGAIAQIQATLPFAQAQGFVSKLKSSITAPDYAENENSSVLTAVYFKQSCDSYVSYLKTFAQSEALYLEQLSAASPTTDTAQLTQKLTETRQNAISYEGSIQGLLGQIYKATITINVMQIPG